MANTQDKSAARLRRAERIRKKVSGTPERPRLSVFRSAKHIYAQAVDDTTGRTLAAAGSREKGFSAPVTDERSGKIAAAWAVGELVAERLLAKNITAVVFDRNGFPFHGRVESVAGGARAKGLQF